MGDWRPSAVVVGLIAAVILVAGDAALHQPPPQCSDGTHVWEAIHGEIKLDGLMVPGWVCGDPVTALCRDRRDRWECPAP